MATPKVHVAGVDDSLLPEHYGGLGIEDAHHAWHVRRVVLRDRAGGPTLAVYDGSTTEQPPDEAHLVQTIALAGQHVAVTAAATAEAEAQAAEAAAVAGGQQAEPQQQGHHLHRVLHRARHLLDALVHRKTAAADHPNAFVLVVGDQSWVFEATTPESRDKWIAHLQRFAAKYQLDAIAPAAKVAPGPVLPAASEGDGSVHVHK